MSIRQLSIFLENKHGSLAQVTGKLAKLGIDIRALSIAEKTEYGLLRIITSDPEKAARQFEEESAVIITPVTAVRMKDRPGELDRIVQVLTAENISIEYLYAFLGKTPGEACLVIRLDDPEKGSKVLAENGFEELTEEQAF